MPSLSAKARRPSKRFVNQPSPDPVICPCAEVKTGHRRVIEGDRIVDSKGRVSRVTTAGAGPSVGKYLLLAYLPPEHAVVGNKLQVMYMNETYPVTVEVAGPTPLFDPTDARMKS